MARSSVFLLSPFAGASCARLRFKAVIKFDHLRRLADLPRFDGQRRIQLVEMNGTSVIGAGSLGDPGPSWHAVASGDFNGDGRADILWQNSSGEVVIWEMNGTS